jgi:hypothetical protein
MPAEWLMTVLLPYNILLLFLIVMLFIQTIGIEVDLDPRDIVDFTLILAFWSNLR